MTVAVTLMVAESLVGLSAAVIMPVSVVAGLFALPAYSGGRRLLAEEHGHWHSGAGSYVEGAKGAEHQARGDVDDVVHVSFFADSSLSTPLNLVAG